MKKECAQRTDREIKSLARFLEGRDVMWFPQALDPAHGGRHISEFCIDQFLRGGAAGCDVILLTDDRWTGVNAKFDDIRREFDEAVIRRGVTVSNKRSFTPISGLAFHLCMVRPEAGRSPQGGRVEAFDVVIEDDDHQQRKMTVILVNAESVEFYMSFLLRKNVQLKAIASWGYFRGFNGCATTAWWLRRAMYALGAQYIYTGANTDIEHDDPMMLDDEAGAKETLSVFPELQGQHSAAIDRFWEGDVGNEEGMKMECYTCPAACGAKFLIPKTFRAREFPVRQLADSRERVTAG